METSSPASADTRWALDSSAQVRRIARRSCAGVCSSARLHRNAEASKKRFTCWSGYWPQTPPLGDADVLVLSRFAYMRRRGNEMVLESPRAGALFRICDPKTATALATLSSPQQVKQLRRRDGFPGLELLALLVDCRILFKVDAAGASGLRPAEGDDN